MKKAFFFLLLIIYCKQNYAQWVPSLTLGHFQSFEDISAPTDKIIWTIISGSVIYKTKDGGKTWNKFQPVD